MRLIDVLKNQVSTNKIVSVFSLEDTTSFVAGFVVYVDDEYFLLKSLTRTGAYDGFVLRKTDQIVKIDMETYYENRLAKMCESNNTKHAEFTSNQSNDDFIINFLEFIKMNAYVVTINVSNYDTPNLMGYIKEIDKKNKTLSVEHLDDYGQKDGYSIINVDSIYRLNCDGEDEQVYKFTLK